MKINKVYADLLPHIEKEEIRYFEIYGGRRSGKSVAVSDILVYMAASEPGHFICCIRKVATSIKDSVYSRMKNSLDDAGVRYTANKTDKEFVLHNGNRIRCFGLDDPEKLKSLESATVLWFEEANEILENDFNVLDAGLSPKDKHARIFLTHNPVPILPGELHWIQERFLLIEHKMSKIAVKDNSLVLRTWYKDNAFCPEATKRVLEGYKDSNPDLYKMWALGEFTRIEGIIFENWDVVDSVPNSVEFKGYGLDFGFSSDPAAMVKVWSHHNDIWLQGIIYQTGLTNKQLYDKMLEAGVDQYDDIVADSAEPKSIQDLYDLGLRGIRGVKKKPNYKAETANKLRGYNIHLVEGDIDLQREFSTWAWARDKMGKMLPKPVDGNDHYIDAFIMFHYENDNYVDLSLSAAALGV